MAKRTRNTAGEQTFLKHAFAHESPNQTGYKQLKYDDATTLPADDSGQEYSPQHHLSSPSLPTLSAAVSSSPQNQYLTNYGHSNGQVYRQTSTNGNSTYLPNGTLTSTRNHSTLATQRSPSTTNPVNANVTGGGHYAANISAAATTPNLPGSKNPLLDLSRTSAHIQTSPAHNSNETHPSAHFVSTPKLTSSFSDPAFVCSNLGCNGIRELLASLGLMCILSLLMAFLALFFLQRSCPFSFLNDDQSHSINGSKVSRNLANHPSQSHLNQRIVTNAKEYMRVFQISVSLSTLTIALDLCCLFVCCIQFLSIVKLLKTPYGKKRSLEFIKKTSHIRVLSIGAFLVSIPIFFTGVILYTFVNFDEIPALITSVIIGIGIIFCGVASVQNVYLWQWEKTKASQDLQHSQQQQAAALRGGHQFIYGHDHTATSAYPLELSTLV